MYTVSLVDSVYGSNLSLLLLSVILCGLAQAVRDVYFTNQNSLLNPVDISVCIALLAEREGLCYALFILSTFVSSVPSPFLYFFAFCTSSPSLFCSWLGTHEKYSSRGEKCWARHLPHLSYSESNTANSVREGTHDIKSEANLALNWSKSDITSGSRQLYKSSI